MLSLNYEPNLDYTNLPGESDEKKSKFYYIYLIKDELYQKELE